MLDIEKLEAILRTGKKQVTVSDGWLAALISEIKGNRATIARLTKERDEAVEKARYQVNYADLPSSTKQDLDQGWDEIDKSMSNIEKGFSAFSRAFGKIRKG